MVRLGGRQRRRSTHIIAAAATMRIVWRGDEMLLLVLVLVLVLILVLLWMLLLVLLEGRGGGHGHECTGESFRVLLVAGGGGAFEGLLEEFGGAAGDDAVVGHGLEDFNSHGDEA